jgi:hypothetical protein
MNESVLVLSNAQPEREPAAWDPSTHRTLDVPGVDGDAYEAMFPEQNPRWRFARRYAGARAKEVYADLHKTQPEAHAEKIASSGLLWLHATSHGPRVGGQPWGPVAMWVVLTNAVDGKDAEFNDWYDTQHIHDTLKVPGVVSAQRYRLTIDARDKPMSWRYLALFNIELDRVAESLAEVAARRGTPRMPNPGYLAPGALAIAFRPIT